MPPSTPNLRTHTAWLGLVVAPAPLAMAHFPFRSPFCSPQEDLLQARIRAHGR